jgi:phage FluMu protein Com
LSYVPSIRSAQTLRCSECPQLLALDDGVERVATA